MERSPAFVFTCSVQMEVLIHDQGEKFTNLNLFDPERVVVRNNTVISLFIRPEVLQKQDKKKDPCTLDEGYSYTRVSSDQNEKKCLAF